MKRTVFFLNCFLFASLRIFSQSNFYSADTIQKIEITFAQSGWDHELDTAKAGADGYVLAALVKVNGVSFDSVGVKYKGYSSFDSTRAKNPLHVKLDLVHAMANYQTFQDIKLGNAFSDPTSLREVLSYEVLRNYMDAPRSNFAQVYINGIYYGLYSNTESIDKDFLNKHSYSAGGSFFKCNPANVVSGQIPNLLYLGTDSANYYSRYEIKSKLKWRDLIDLCDTLANQTAHVDSVLDIDRALWMLAFNNVTVNLDSYTGAFSQNYYLYRDGNQRFIPLIWDLNMCFGGFPSTGSGTLNIAGMQTMSLMLHSANGARPLIMNLLANSTYSKMYIAHMRTINSEFFTGGNYLTRAQALQAEIDTAVQSEAYSLYSYAQFQAGLTTNTGTIPGISNLMSVRTSFLSGTTQFQQVPPVISSVTTTPAAINLNDTIWVRCKVSGQTSVLLGYRNFISARFRRYTMFDDGSHHDAAAGDSIFGAGMPANAAQMQYYIYAENGNAGIFSPERAEHEFYSASVNVPLPAVGDVVVNEFLADNISDTTDEAGQHEDWIELYNTTSLPINLYGLFLSDDPNQLNKYIFPNPSMIQPYGFLMLWADQDASTPQYLHCNFNLSGQGEQIILSNCSTLVLDNVSFGLQHSDTSMGRCPDGLGPIAQMPFTTFNASNCSNGIPELSDTAAVSIFPNPATDWVDFKFNRNVKMDNILIISSIGQILNVPVSSGKEGAIDITSLGPGLYCILFQQQNKTLMSARFVKQ